MGEARKRDEWSRSSSLMALLANINRDPKKTDAFKPSDFDPTVKRSNAPVPKLKMSQVKDLLMSSVQQKRCK